MTTREVKRRAWVLAAGPAVLLVTACTGGGHAAVAGKNVTASARAAGSEAEAGAQSRPRPRAVQAKPQGSASIASGVTVQKVLAPPAAKPVTVRLSGASAGAAGRFRAATASVRGLSTGATYRTATVDGSAVADVAVYRFAASSSKSPIFQGQIVRQLVALAAPATTVRFDQVANRQVAVATATSVAAGWFAKGVVVVVLGGPGKAALGQVSDVVRNYPPSS